MVRVKKGLASVEVDTDLPEEMYGDAKKYFNKDEKKVIATAGNIQGGATTEQIADASNMNEGFVERTMLKAQKHGGAKKKAGKWYTDPKLAIALVGAVAFIIIAMALGGTIAGATADMGDVSAGKTAVPLQQSPFSSALGVGDVAAGRGLQFTPLLQSPFSAPATIGEIGEGGLGQQLSPFSPIRQASIGTTIAGEGGIAAPEIKQSGANILGKTNDYGNIYQGQGDRLVIGDGNIYQEQNIAQQGDVAGLVNVNTIKQSADYKGLDPETRKLLEDYL